MEHDFWLARWRAGEIGFHQAEINPTLRRLWPDLGIPSGEPVFVPLCGKSLDMRFLEECGHPVLGVELSEAAVEAYFEEGGEVAQREPWGEGSRLRARTTTLCCGDYFALGRAELEGVRAVYDRAALIALPTAMRRRYVHHMLDVLDVKGGAQILLFTLEYDQDAVPGPPFSVGDDEVRLLYGVGRVTLLDEREAKGLPPKFEALRNKTARAYQIEFGQGIELGGEQAARRTR